MLVETYANNAESSLSAAIDSSTLSIPVNNAASFPSTGYFRIIIDAEIIWIKSVSGNTLTAEARGVESTVAVSHPNGSSVIQIVTKGALDNILTGPIGSESIEGQGNFLMACHKSADEAAYLMQSPDGISWNLINPARMFTPVSGNQRDPGLMYWNEKYWVCHTNSTNTFWTLLSSPNLFNWDKIADVSMTAIGSVHRVWAPEFFIDTDGTVRVFVAVSTGGSTTNFQIYEMHATNAALTTWSTPVVLTGTSLRSNMIDPHVVKRSDGFYYVWYKDDTTKYVEIMRSTSLTSGYVKWKESDWAGWGSGLEGPTVVRLSSSKWRVYLNENSGLNSVGVWYSDSSSDDWSSATWSTKARIISPWTVAHPTVIRVRDYPTFRNMTSLFMEKSRPRGVVARITSNKSINTGSTTAVIFDDTIRDEFIPNYWASGQPTRITVNATGWYLVQGQITWASNTSGKRVVDIRVNGSVFEASVSQGTGADNQNQNTMAALYLEKDDYLELTVFQNSGGAINVTAARFRVMRMF